MKLSLYMMKLLCTWEYMLMYQSSTVGKSHKYNDRDHAGLADGTALPQEHLAGYFAKWGHIDADPKKAKKNGAGKGGWYSTPSHSHLVVLAPSPFNNYNFLD